MAKAYWVATYRSISDPDALAGYAKLAGPAIQAAGGRFLARGTAAKAYEAGVLQRVVIVEFDSVEKATAAHDSPGYQEALKVLGKGADRDLRIVQLTHDMRKPPRPSSCRNRDLSHVLVNRMVAIHSVGKDPDGSSDVVACVHDHLDALAADLRL